jgi:hypothetical protein
MNWLLQELQIRNCKSRIAIPDCWCLFLYIVNCDNLKNVKIIIFTFVNSRLRVRLLPLTDVSRRSRGIWKRQRIVWPLLPKSWLKPPTPLTSPIGMTLKKHFLVKNPEISKNFQKKSLKIYAKIFQNI